MRFGTASGRPLVVPEPWGCHALLYAPGRHVAYPRRIGGRSGSADGLWKHTCFEAFIRPGESSGYYEFNFRPTRQWAVYRFDSYRQGMTPMDLANPPVISTSRAADHMVLQATVPLPFSADSGAARRTKLALDCGHRRGEW